MKRKNTLLGIICAFFYGSVAASTCVTSPLNESEDASHKREMTLILRDVRDHINKESITRASQSVSSSQLKAVREAGFPEYARSKALNQAATIPPERLSILAKLIFHGGAYVDYGRVFHEMKTLPDALFCAIAQGGFWARHLNLVFDQVHVEEAQGHTLTPAHMAPLGAILRALHSAFDPRAVIQEAATLPADKLAALAQASYKYSAYTLFVLAHARDLEADDITRLKAVFG